MKTKIKLFVWGIGIVLLGWGIWKAWDIYQVMKTVKENVPGVSLNTDGVSLVKEDEQGNKFDIKIGSEGISISGNKDGQPIEIKVDAAGMKVGNGEKQIQIPIEELKKQFKLMNGAKKESVEE